MCSIHNGNLKSFVGSDLEKRQNLPHYRSNICFKGTGVNRALSSLHGWTINIAFAIPLKIRKLEQVPRALLHHLITHAIKMELLLAKLKKTI